MLLSAFCCRARTFIEPVTAFVCDMLPEHKRETPSMGMLYEAIEKLPMYAIMDISKWLFHKIISVIKEEVGRAGPAALQVGCHHDHP